ncbi:MAG TPA: aminoacyl-tRNA hydrolase [Ruminococcaceae bacterium]|nr:aminoacyl-tRNA hydrolase [Oscillospiraceae bacterium]HCK50973.1 aminoacyl-tRNA hydrolase [Oscillospiraceae bacterium]
MSIADIFKKLESERTPAPQGAVEYIICGLGNPGTQYEGTRHNIGFMTIDTLCEKYKLDCKKLRFKSLTCDAMISGKRCLIMKPTTFMNNSGEAVTEAMSFYKIPPERTIIVFDDISLEPGKLRIRRKGSDGGHNGIKSIIYLSGSDMFPRIKMGVGAKPHPDYNLADWVLGHFRKEQAEALETAMDNAVSSIELMVGGKMNEAMNKFNS